MLLLTHWTSLSRKARKTSRSKNMKTVASADALTFLRLTFHPKNKNGAKTQNFSCSVIKCYHICHLIFLLAPVLLCIGKREHRKKMWVMIMRISCLRKKKTWIRFFLSWRNGGKFSFHLPVFHFSFSHISDREKILCFCIIHSWMERVGDQKTFPKRLIEIHIYSLVQSTM